ncbi:hypothetical protein Bca4012_015060 [Brassica carinata]
MVIIMGKLLLVMLIGLFMAFQSLGTLDYGHALNKSILFFEGQRSGKLPAKQRVTWRADSALSDGSPDNVNLIGGYYDAGDGNSDHACWERPEDMDTARTLYKISSSSPGSEVAAEAAAALASASLHRGSYQASCPFYCSHSGYKEFYNGKNELGKFKNDVESFVCALMPGSSSQQIKPTPGGLLFTRDGSNLQYATTATTVLFHYSKTLTQARVGSIQCGSTKFTVSQIHDFAKSQVDYILGNNPMKMSYMVGFGNKCPTQPHHRASSLPSIKSKPDKIDCKGGFSYYNSDQPNPNVLLGAIVGGPDSSDHFSDKRTDYSHAEPTTYINAAFIGPVAALICRNSN